MVIFTGIHKAELTLSLNKRIKEIMADPYPFSPKPSKETLDKAHLIGERLIAVIGQLIPVLNISVAEEGSMCFTFFSKNTLDLELWVEDDTDLQEIPCILAGGAVFKEETVSIDALETILPWIYQGSEPSSYSENKGT